MDNENTRIPLTDPAAEDFAAELKKSAAETTGWTDDFKADVQKATEQLALEVAAWKEFWEDWIPGGLRRRKRYRTQGHGLRRMNRRQKGKVARKARRANRRSKKRSR